MNERLENKEKLNREWALRGERQRQLAATEQMLAAVGIGLDDLIALIEARQEGSY